PITTKRTTQPLAEYKRKRDFTQTAEPSGAKGGAASRRALRFVIQKHAASHLHYDFRLELDGVMKSWAVPKGPSYDPAVRRLAMEVEDHPIEYNTFEGTIPKGQYGGGTVMLWDRGTYEPEAGGGVAALRDGLARGDLKIVLHGKRLIGGWVLVRMRRDGVRAQWLLIKHRDETADPKCDVTADVLTSVASGRTMEQIATGKSRVWNSDRPDTPVKRKTATSPTNTSRKKTATKVTAKKPAAKKIVATKKKATPARTRRAGR
ncbi:MAG: DNA polymerase ligase N-terminal domain-containing protein, partial [Gemmatimonadaceae bacterium]